LKRRHKTIIPYSDSNENCNGISIKNEILRVERLDVDCDEDSFADQNAEKKSLVEYALHTRTRLADIKNSHRKKGSSLLDGKKKGFLDRKHETIIIDSDSE
jgi:hypothetical protein